MSKENAKQFFEELARNEAMQEELAALAGKLNFDFTREELQEVLDEIASIRLSDDELDGVSAGAFPTSVNDQITDSVT